MSDQSPDMHSPQTIRKQAPYIFYGQTTALCGACLMPVPAKIIIEGGDVFHLKRCTRHGVQKVKISSDAAYFKQCKDYLKPGDRPLRVQTRTEYGCPLDCGLCPDHEQHSCLALVEINEACNLNCPVCFADSSTSKTSHRPLEDIEAMLDALVASEGEPDLVQISGGEPTIHPQFFDVLDAAKRRSIRHLMVNTNGIRIAKDPAFAERLARYVPRFEVYLQFDSLQRDALMDLRGADLREVRLQALRRLEELGISTTLVVTVKRSVNDDEIGDIVKFALEYDCVRGVTFQTIQDAGRNEGFAPPENRMLLSDVRKAVIADSGVFGADDLMPLPCHPEQICIGYGLRKGTSVTPLLSLLPKDLLLDAAPNTIAFESFPALREAVFDLLSLSTAASDSADRLGQVLCCLPQAAIPETITYADTFRIVILEFMDRHNFDVGGVKRSCMHFVQPDGRIIPFDTFNLFYRDGQVENLRQRLRPDTTDQRHVRRGQASLEE